MRWSLALLAVICAGSAAAAPPRFNLAKTALDPSELAVVVNIDDPESEAISVFYQQRRKIPDENIIRVHLGSPASNLPREQFARAKAQVDSSTPTRIQAYALAWTRPYRVDCMSITSAFALGFDAAYCSAKQCATTRASLYFNSPSVAPFDDFHLRPAMMLAGKTFQEVKSLILRGVAADHSFPRGTAYLLNTSDRNRSVRSVFFETVERFLKPTLPVARLDADAIQGKSDVLFYFTGMAKVEKLGTLKFLPGAIADHLTSTGGQLTDSGQMSSLRWLEAGATGSYGAVVEPCNHLGKFPNPAVVIARYLTGGSLIEAYWKSVAWPGEGLFIGEPLARPYEPQIVRMEPSSAQVRIFSPVWGNLRLESSASPMGPFGDAEPVPVKPGLNRLSIHLPDPSRYYRLGF